MKKLVATLCVSALAIGAFAQGSVSFANTSTTLIRTNGAGASSGTGSMTGAGNYVFAVFTAQSTVTSLDASLQDLLTPSWTFTGLYGTNIGPAGRFAGGTGVTVPTGWAAGVTNSYTMVGWSASLGHDWNIIANELAGATLSSGTWKGTNIIAGGFIGASTVGFGAPGGGTTGAGPFSLVGAPSGQGTPVNTGWDLFATVAVPEPASFALVGLGAAALVIFRRRKA